MSVGADQMLEEWEEMQANTLDASTEPLSLGARDPQSGRLILSPKRTLPTAKAYVREFHQHNEGRTLRSHHGSLIHWQDNRYIEIEDATVKHRLLPWLHDAVRPQVSRSTGETVLTDFDANPTTVNHALESIRTYVHLDEQVASPCWLDGRTDPPADELIPCRTLNLHVPTGCVIPATPALFNVNALDFDFDPHAPEPMWWLNFLADLLGDDAESIELLQEWFGYCLGGDTSQQKILLLVGPRRSGKGTIGRVLTRLVGDGNVANPTTASLAGTFGLQPLIAKSLAIVSDARFSGEGVPTVVERCLNISGEDRITIDRKFLPSVTMKLPTRFMLLTNELPRLKDASIALAGRFLVVHLQELLRKREPHPDPEIVRGVAGDSVVGD